MQRSERGAGLRHKCIAGLSCVALGLLAATAQAAEKQQPRVWRGAETTHPVAPTLFRGSVYDLPAAKGWKPGDPIKEIPRRGSGTAGKTDPYAQAAARARTAMRDPLLDRQERAAYEFAGRASRAFDTPTMNFAGQGFTGVNPPDTVGDVGPTYYVQAINGSGGSRVAIYDKATGALAVPVFAMDGFGSGSCASGAGDPIVLYDQMAERWLLSEFSGVANVLCVYVSTTPDPTAAGWFAYAFTAPSFPDYPKYGVWPDAYYVSSNEGSPAAYAMDRNSMLAGAPATIQRFSTSALSAFTFNALQPADVDGVISPPGGSPGVFMRHRDDEAHNPGSANPVQDTLEIFEFDVDFAVPANSTFTGPISIPIAEIDSELCGFTAFACFPQPGSGVTLDPLREVVMFRVAYRNFGAHQTLVGNLVTDVSGTNQGGVRWFELRNSGGGWSLFQEGTVAPDSDSRFMGSIAMDGDENIALGYSVTSTSTFPSMRYTGRLASDPAGTMPQGEHTIVNGAGANNSNRYGDYSAMNIDPVDDCTFWHTNMYAQANGTWATQIASFRFDACIDPGFTLLPDDFNPQVCAPAAVDPIDLTVGSVFGFSNPVTLSLNSPVAGITGSFTVNPVTPVANTVLNLAVDGTVTAGEYPVTVEGTASGAANEQAVINVGVATATPSAVVLASPANGSSVLTASPTLTWNSIVGATGYDVEVATDPGFGNIVASASGLTATSFQTPGLATNTVHYWRVRAGNICGSGGFSAAFSFTTGSVICATGPVDIPDGSGSFVSLDAAAAGSGVISDLDVSIRATHSYVGDLIFTLEHLDTGTAITVVDRPGVPATTFGCPGDDVDATFDDASGTPVETFCGAPGLNGVLAPQQPLAAFNGESLGGTWRLSASDNAGFDTGTLDEWCLIPTVTGSDIDNDGIDDSVDNCTAVANPLQQDFNGDDIGDICDADVEGPPAGGFNSPEDCVVDFLDLQRVKEAFFSNPALPLCNGANPGACWDPEVDFDNSDQINFVDLQIMKDQFFGPPGPSAAGCN